MENLSTTFYNFSTTLPDGMNAPKPGEVPLKTPIFVQAIVITMYSIIIALSIGGNGIVCYIVFRARRMRTVINFFIVSLAMSDITMAVLCIPFTFIANLILNFWPFGDALCPVVTYLQHVTVFLSSYTLVAIAIDRFFAIIYPLRPKMTKRQAFFVISAIWVFSFVMNIPTAITATAHRYVNKSTAPVFCEEIWEDKTLEYVYGILILLLQYFIPLLILILAYGKIIVAMWILKAPGEALQSRDMRMTESKRKIIKMMLTVVIIYAICWLPLNVINIAGDINPRIYNIKGMNYVWMSFHWLAMSNCMYNPFIYCWMNGKFRDGFLKVLNRFTCGLIKDNADIEMTRFRRNDTVTTSVGGNGSLLRYPSKTRSDSYQDYSSMLEKTSKESNVLVFESDQLKS